MTTEKALREALDEIALRFVSGNKIQIDSARISRSEWLLLQSALSLPETVGEPVAWATPDGERCIPSHTKNAALKDGGAMLSSVACFNVPLYAAPAAPTNGEGV